MASQVDINGSLISQVEDFDFLLPTCANMQILKSISRLKNFKRNALQKQRNYEAKIVNAHNQHKKSNEIAPGKHHNLHEI